MQDRKSQENKAPERLRFVVECDVTDTPRDMQYDKPLSVGDIAEGLRLTLDNHYRTEGLENFSVNTDLVSSAAAPPDVPLPFTIGDDVQRGRNAAYYIFDAGGNKVGEVYDREFGRWLIARANAVPAPSDAPPEPDRKTEESPILAFEAWLIRWTQDNGRKVTQTEYGIAYAAFIAAHPGKGPTANTMGTPSAAAVNEAAREIVTQTEVPHYTVPRRSPVAPQEFVSAVLLGKSGNETP